MAEKRVIKASEVEASGINVEKVDYEIRKFGNKVYKNAPLDEQPMTYEDQANPAGSGLTDGNPADSDSEEPQVELERFYGDQGELVGLKIICRCGEVIELEFTREQDELPPDAEQQAPPAQSSMPQEQSGQAPPDAPEPESLESQ
jgi:hypothetical protein